MTVLIDNLLEYTLNLTVRVDKAYARSFNQAEIASIYLINGQKEKCLNTLADCLKTIESLKRPEEKSERLAWAGRIYALAGEPEKAKDALSRAVLLADASAPNELVSGLYRAAGEYLDAGLREKAGEVTLAYYKAALGLENDTDKTLELINIADLYLELEQDQKAGEILAEALALSLTIKDNWFKTERLLDIAGEYLEIGLKNEADSVIKNAISVSGSTGQENQPYFLLKITDFFIAGDNRTEARKYLEIAEKVILNDESAYSRSKNLLESAEKYRQVDKTDEAVRLASQSLDILQKVQDVSIEDKISGLIDIAVFLGKLDQKEKALETAGPCQGLSKNVQDKKTRIFLLGKLVLLYGRLGEDETAPQIITDICQVISEVNAKTQGLGAVVIDLAAAGKYALALQISREIRDPHIKSSAIANIAKNIIDSGWQQDEQVEDLVKEIISQTT